MTIRHMRIAYWTPKATNTHSQYVILITFPLQQRLHERASMLRYTYIACLVRDSSSSNGDVVLGTFQILMAMVMASFGMRRHVCV